jgi:hypothetical protein
MLRFILQSSCIIHEMDAYTSATLNYVVVFTIIHIVMLR